MKPTDSNVVPLRQIDPLDKHVGGRILIGRRLVGVSLEKLGGEIGVTYQQVQKYETGANRVSAARLYLIAETLNLPVTFFFEDYEQAEKVETLGDASKTMQFLESFASTQEGLKLINAFIRINDKAMRDELIQLTETVATRLAEAAPPPARD